MTLKAVLFDIDGTLVDSNDYHVLAWQRAFAEAGINLPESAIHSQIGKGADMLVPSLVPALNAAMHEQLSDAHSRIFKDEYLPRVRPFPGARELLIRTQEAGRTVVLASSASRGELQHYLELLHAKDVVSASTSGDDVDRTKPAPDIFSAALAKLNDVAPEQAMVVGDTPYDIEAAARCGITAIALRSGKFPDDELEGALSIYDDAAALLADFASSPLG